MLLTASRVSEEKKANPGYRAFFANGFNVTRSLALVVWEVILEVVASARQRRRDVLPRGHRGGIYPLLRAGMCVVVRDLTVYAVLTDHVHRAARDLRDLRQLRRGCAPLRARAPGHARGAAQARRAVRPDRASPPLRAAALPHRRPLRPRADAGRDLQAAQRLRARGARPASVEADTVHAVAGEDESRTNVGVAFDEATGQGDESGEKRSPKKDVSGQDVVVLGSGNLGPRLPDGRAAAADAGGDRRAPPAAHPGARSAPARRLRARPLRGGRAGRARPDGARYLADDRVEGDDPLAPFSPTAAVHLQRSDGFAHAPDLFVNSFYDPELDEGCAFEELISFHGGMGGLQTRPFILAPSSSRSRAEDRRRRPRARVAAGVAPPAAGCIRSLAACS